MGETLEEAVRELESYLYHKADELDKETGDNKDDLIRAGQQAMALDIAERIGKILHD